MNLPASDILIDNIVYSVGIQDRKVMAAEGKMVGSSNQLLLAADQTPADFLDTFGHEVLHALIRARCPRAATEGAEEAFVQAITPGIIQVLRDNPDWLAWAVRLVLTSGKRQPKTRPTPAAATPPNPEKETPDARTDRSNPVSREPSADGQGPHYGPLTGG